MLGWPRPFLLRNGGHGHACACAWGGPLLAVLSGGCDQPNCPEGRACHWAERHFVERVSTGAKGSLH
eukprot:3740708-Alexandrium_andersonii.AAC.1